MTNPNKKSNNLKKVLMILGIIILVLYVGTFIRHQTKGLPSELNYESAEYDLYEEEVKFLRDITVNIVQEERILDHEIFYEFQDVVQKAEKFLVLNMFMFTDLGSEDDDFPTISRDLKLAILNQMEQYPDLNVWIITDHINTSYGSHEAERIEALEEKGAKVVYADLSPLRDPIPIYSTFYRMFFQWFGQGSRGWLPNPFGQEEPEVSLASYLKMLNTNGNHRKVLITEKEGIYTSANAHDPSGYHSNIGVRVQGPFLEAFLEGEQRVVSYNRGNDQGFPTKDDLMIEEVEGEPSLKGKVLTEGKIFEEAMEIIGDSTPGEDLWLGMYLLSDPDVIEALKDAADRGVRVRMILDPNQTSFGNDKPGIPNVAVTHRMNIVEEENMDVRWYNVDEEQYHSKILFLDGEEARLLAGSTNFTKRSFHQYNLENNLSIKASKDSALIEDVREYFLLIWNNEEHQYTLDFDQYQDKLSWGRRAIFRIQKTLRLTTF